MSVGLNRLGLINFGVPRAGPALNIGPVQGSSICRWWSPSQWSSLVRLLPFFNQTCLEVTDITNALRYTHCSSVLCNMTNHFCECVVLFLDLTPASQHNVLSSLRHTLFTTAQATARFAIHGTGLISLWQQLLHGCQWPVFVWKPFNY